MTVPLIDRKPLSPLGHKLLDALMKADRWMTRKELAQALHKDRLHVSAVHQLRRLMTYGMIEARRVPAGRGPSKLYEYRIKPGAANAP